ncbi:uncharacterized protein Z520_03138 [Fonsecaea multimorphosa CBS 102226]|uniref:DUF6594 domain-containing protein n=1 Tax=Fonsecaea multimorphosa CBS 102226 TaxID=1442371 RepID=A0A0D2HI41_9EURO|nr:uncharacterized protein Z520_03138 [Fonsecaea multimorphosa CBS 102226]KIY01586.1 hypothetical protein Z520_03138 [Fonsecaea multimorphosa CBS 102226]OAL28098.1 hypothetical protein AYO22_03125 [Fonsecaea multimorphosa]
MDAQSGQRDRQMYSRDWWKLQHVVAQGNHSEQWNLALEIREKLERYDDALLRYHQISTTLARPRRIDVDILAKNLTDPSLPDDYLLGLDKSIWKDEKLREDLISVNPVHDFSIITKSLIKTCLRPYHNVLGHRSRARKSSQVNADADLHHYEDEHLERAADVISTVVASILPVVAIVVLYIVHPMPARLGLIAAFTATF